MIIRSVFGFIFSGLHVPVVSVVIPLRLQRYIKNAVFRVPGAESTAAIRAKVGD